MFGEKILEYWDDILKDLEKVIAIPSVCGPAEGEYPYGKECARAIDAVVEMAEGYGLKTKNVGYYAAHAEYGEGEGNAVVMNHMDVVPAPAEGWDTDPFTMVIKGDRAYGRGVGDNKGPAIISLHCLRALKDAGIKGNRKLRVIFGSGEEIGMDDMNHYFASEQKPDMGFSPDSAYGICHCEKGIINFTVTGENDSPVVSFASGTVSNAVPAKAECQVKCTAEEADKLTAAAKDGAPAEFVITKTADGASVLCRGRAAHASRPEGGINAAAHLVKLLVEVFGKERMGKFFTFAYEKIGLCNDGELIGVKCSDEPSGPLTFNLGLMHVKDRECSLKVDIRYPATLKGSEISDTIAGNVAPYGLTYTLLSDAEPLYLPKESQLITLLSGAYKDVTGKECDIFSMGGGTYARTMFNNGVAFGASFPEQEPGHAHDVNEFIELEYMKLHAQICLESMYRMFTAE